MSSQGDLLQYQWQENTGNGWINLSNGTNVKGVNTNKLEISTVVQSMNNNNYRCQVDNSTCDSVLSASAKLTISDLKLAFTLDSAISCHGFKNGKITAEVSGGKRPYKYLWGNSSVDSFVRNVAAGWHTIRIVDANNDTLVDSINILEPSPLSYAPGGRTLVYEETFTKGQTYCPGSSQYDNWKLIRTSLDPDNVEYSEITLSGSLYSGITLDNPIKIDSIIWALKLGVKVSIIDKNGYAWNVGAGCSSGCAQSGDDVELNVNFSGNYVDCSCGNGPTIRPGIGSEDWGGFDPNAGTCNASSQTMRVEFKDGGGPILTHLTCFDSEDGVIQISPFGGTAPYTYQWSNNDKDTIADSLLVGSHLLSLTDNNGCEFKDTFVLTQPSKVNSGSIAGIDTICGGDTASNIYEVAPANGGIGVYNYAWQASISKGPWITIKGADSTILEPGPIARTTRFRRIAVDTNNCDADTSNVVAIVVSEPVASFSVAASCENEHTYFKDLSFTKTGSITGYFWSFGDQGTSNKQNPLNIYKRSGEFNVKLIVTGTGGCTDTTTQRFIVNPLPVVNFSATSECNGVATKFTNKSSISSGTLSYTWNLGNKSKTASTSPNYTYINAGFYNVKLIATSSKGCIDSTSKTVQVKHVPKAVFSANSVCEGLRTSFKNSSINATKYSWDFGDSLGTSTNENSTYKYDSSGIYTTTLTATSADGCSDTTQEKVTVFTLPKASFTANDVCLGDSTTLANNSVDASNFQWFFGNGASSNKLRPDLLYGISGKYSIELTATTINGCSDTISKTIMVNALPSVNFSTSDICLSEDLKVTNTTSGASQYSWTFGDGSSSSAISPTHTYLVDGNYEVKLIATSANGCVDSSKTNINAFAVPEANFSAANVCERSDVVFNNSSKIATGNITYLWDLGNGAKMSNISPVYKYASNGNYTVRLFAASNNGCEDSSTQIVTVYAMPKVDFVAPNVCYGDTLFTKNLSSGATSYNWNFADGNKSTAISPFNFYKKSGNYNVKLVATTINGCVDSLLKTVDIYNKPIAGFDAKDVCDSSEVFFANNSYNASLIKHNWSFDDGTTSASMNPRHTYATYGRYNVTLIVVSDNTCADTITQNVEIYPNPIVAFTNTNECDYDITKFTNQSSIVYGKLTYEWDFGNGSKSNLVNPKHKFSQPGTHMVDLKVSSSRGCFQSVSDTVVVYPSPIAGIELGNNCEGQFSEFRSESSVSKGKFLAFKWLFGDGESSTKRQPLHLYKNDGIYNISLVATTNKGCLDTALASITIYNKPTADFSTPNVCFGKLNAFTNASVDAQDYTYDFGDRWGISVLAEPEYTYEEPGTYMPTLYVTSEFGCRDTISKTIIIHQLPIARFGVNDHCFGEVFTPTDNSLGTVTNWNWNYDNGDKGSGLNPIYTYGKAGDYNVRLIVRDANSCVDSVRKTVTVWPLPDVWVRADTMVSRGYEVPLEARGGVAYKWSPVDNLDRPLTATPIATVIEDITYTVTVANEFACTKDTFVNLRQEEDYTLEPSNIMTPDGNGQNDNWIVEKAQYYNDVDVIVFDRWGRIVYQNANYDNTWEGISQATGEALPDGAYYYIVKVPADRDEYKGSITIFR